MSQLVLDFARAEVAKLDKQCRETFQAGTDFLPVTQADMAHSLQLYWEYHRLWRAREEARVRLARMECAISGTPANDTVPARDAELPHR